MSGFIPSDTKFVTVLQSGLKKSQVERTVIVTPASRLFRYSNHKTYPHGNLAISPTCRHFWVDDFLKFPFGGICFLLPWRVQASKPQNPTTVRPVCVIVGIEFRPSACTTDKGLSTLGVLSPRHWEVIKTGTANGAMWHGPKFEKKMASEGTKKGSCVWICLKKCLLKHLSCSNDCISIHNKKPNFTSPVPFPQFRLTRTPSFFSNHGKNRGQKMPEITNSQSTSGPKGAPTVDLAKLPLLFKCSKRIITWIIAGTKMEHTHTRELRRVSLSMQKIKCNIKEWIMYLFTVQHLTIRYNSNLPKMLQFIKNSYQKVWKIAPILHIRSELEQGGNVQSLLFGV